jgi:DNA-binding MarR family transcriptional regulator
VTDRDGDDGIRAPLRLRALASWQAGKVATLGTRLTAQHMPLSARSDFAALAALEEFGPLSQADIGRRLGLDRNDVNGILTRLDSRGRVDRRPDPADRRRNIVTLTDAGHRYLNALQHKAHAVQAELLAGLDTTEQRQLQALLDKVLAGHRPQPA